MYALYASNKRADQNTRECICFLLSIKHIENNVQDSKQSSYLHISIEWFEYYLVANSRDMFSRDLLLMPGKAKLTCSHS